jgi:hypothetical protein
MGFVNLSDGDAPADRLQGLIAVGTGIQAAGQLTIEARSAIEHADIVFFLVADPVTCKYIESLNKNVQSLHDCYATDKPRMESYLEMIERIIAKVKEGMMVCVVLYGHPGVFAYPAHEAIRRLKSEGIYTKMLPGVSAEDCLFADLGVDPAWGCQSFEATDFLIFQRTFDTRSSLILWQIGLIGDTSFQGSGYNYKPGLAILTETLVTHYGDSHKVIIYEASHYPIYDCRRDTLELGLLCDASVSPESTLYVPPLSPPNPNPEMMRRLGISDTAISHIRAKLE